jgi:hypothetical protein
MFAILHALGMFVADLFKSRGLLEAENCFSAINSASLYGGPHLDVFIRQFWTALLMAIPKLEPRPQP